MGVLDLARDEQRVAEPLLGLLLAPELDQHSTPSRLRLRLLSSLARLSGQRRRVLNGCKRACRASEPAVHARA